MSICFDELQWLIFFAPKFVNKGLNPNFNCTRHVFDKSAKTARLKSLANSAKTYQVPEDDGVLVEEVLVAQTEVPLVVQHVLQLLAQHQGAQVGKHLGLRRARTPVNTTGITVTTTSVTSTVKPPFMITTILKTA